MGVWLVKKVYLRKGNTRKVDTLGDDLLNKYAAIITLAVILQIMNTKRLLIISWTVTAILVIATVLSYVINFRNASISTSPEHWGQLGDFIGGILNPFIALINLVVLTYISISISRIEEDRNKFTLQELARPYGEIRTTRQDMGLIINYKNCGLGPLIITKIAVSFDGKDHPHFINILPPIPKNKISNWGFYYLHDSINGVLGKDDEVEIVKIIGNKNDLSLKPYFDNVQEVLIKCKLTINYTDIYDGPMKSSVFDFTTIGDINA